MANYGATTQRPSTNPPPPPAENDDVSKDSSKKKIYTIAFSFPFDIPSSPESAAIRVARNLESFSLYYATFVWTVLFIALIPRRNVSIVFLVAATEVAFLYSLLLRALPGSVLHRIIDKRIVFFILFVVAGVALVLTNAALHLLIVLASTVPLVILHAALSKRDAPVEVDEDGEMARLVQEKLGGGGGGGVGAGADAGADAQPDNLV